MRRIHQDDEAHEEFMLDLDEIAREGARRMLAEALEAEVEAYVESARAERDERGHALVTRNGHAVEREVLLGAGSVAVKTPRVNDRRICEEGDRKRFASVILPPYMRKSPKVSEVLPLLYLHGLSPAGTSFRPSKSSSEAGPDSPRRASPASPRRGKPRGRVSWSAISRGGTTSTCGWMAYTPAFASEETAAFAAW